MPHTDNRRVHTMGTLHTPPRTQRAFPRERLARQASPHLCVQGPPASAE